MKRKDVVREIRNRENDAVFSDDDFQIGTRFFSFTAWTDEGFMGQILILLNCFSFSIRNLQKFKKIKKSFGASSVQQVSVADLGRFHRRLIDCRGLPSLSRWNSDTVIGESH